MQALFIHRLERYLFGYQPAFAASSSNEPVIVPLTFFENTSTSSSSSPPLCCAGMRIAASGTKDEGSLTTLDAKRRLSALALPYTACAFGETLQTISPESANEHFDHLIGGDAICVAGWPLVESTKEWSKQVSCGVDSPQVVEEAGLVLVAHHLVSYYDLPASRSGERLVVQFGEGIATDPRAPKIGIASRLYSATLRGAEFLHGPNRRLAFASGLTQNPKAILLIREGLAARAVIFPLDYTTDSKDAADSERAQAQRVAEHIISSRPKLQAVRSKYDAEQMVFRELYGATRTAVFAPKSKQRAVNDLAVKRRDDKIDQEKRKMARVMDASRGDAVMIVVACGNNTDPMPSSSNNREGAAFINSKL